MDRERLTTFTDQDDGANASISVGEAFAIRLVENPTTGYRWRLMEAGDPILRLIRDDFRPAEPTRPGLAGEHYWEVAGQAPGDTIIRLEYRRGWVAGPPARTFSLRVRVLP